MVVQVTGPRKNLTNRGSIMSVLCSLFLTQVKNSEPWNSSYNNASSYNRNIMSRTFTINQYRTRNEHVRKMQVAVKNVGLQRDWPSCSALVTPRTSMREARVCFPFNKRLRYPTGCGFIKATDGCQQLPAEYNYIRDYSRENSCNFRVQHFSRMPFARINDKKGISSENSRSAMFGTPEWADTIHFPLLLIMCRL